MQLSVHTGSSLRRPLGGVESKRHSRVTSASSPNVSPVRILPEEPAAPRAPPSPHPARTPTHSHNPEYGLLNPRCQRGGLQGHLADDPGERTRAAVCVCVCVWERERERERRQRCMQRMLLFFFIRLSGCYWITWICVGAHGHHMRTQRPQGGRHFLPGSCAQKKTKTTKADNTDTDWRV